MYFSIKKTLYKKKLRKFLFKLSWIQTFIKNPAAILSFLDKLFELHEDINESLE